MNNPRLLLLDALKRNPDPHWSPEVLLAQLDGFDPLRGPVTDEAVEAALDVWFNQDGLVVYWRSVALSGFYFAQMRRTLAAALTVMAGASPSEGAAPSPPQEIFRTRTGACNKPLCHINLECSDPHHCEVEQIPSPGYVNKSDTKPVETPAARSADRPEWTAEKEKILQFMANHIASGRLGSNVLTVSERDCLAGLYDAAFAKPAPARAWPPSGCRLPKECWERCHGDNNCPHAGERADG